MSESWRRFGFGTAVVVVLVTVVVTVVIGILRGAAAPTTTVTITEEPTVIASSAPLAVHVSGQVITPGLYLLDPGARVVDAIAAAGGFGAEASRDAVNLARPLTDGEQVVVPAIGEEPPQPGATGSGGGVINLNRADAAELETLPRIGPALAQRIVEWREQNDGFTSVDDLLAVPGIGEKLLQGLRESVTVG